MGNRIVISESQYSRLFLNEQPNKDKVNVFKTGYERAQQQWAAFGADNPKTGRDLIPDDSVKYYKDLSVQAFKSIDKKWEEVGKYKLSPEDEVRIYGDTESGGISLSARQSNLEFNNGYKPFGSLSDEETKNLEIRNNAKIQEYNQIIIYNDNIKNQKKLIPQHCKKPNITRRYYEFIHGTGESGSVSKSKWEYWTKRKKEKNGTIGWYNSKPGVIPKYGLYLSFQDNPGEDPFIHCNNEMLKGVWVYETEVGPYCGCYVPDNQKYMSDLGVSKTDYLLGYNQKVEKYVKSKEPGFLDSVAQWAGGCTEDYHCVLDILSIAALAVPGVGLALSAGLDFVNGISYGVEGYNATNSADRYAAILAGGLTMFGGLMGGGIKQTNKILKYGAKNPKIFEYASDVMTTVQKEYKGVKNLKSIDPDTGLNILGKKRDPKLSEIYGQAAEKYGLTNNEVLIAHDLLKNFSKIDPAIAKQYTNALTALENKIQKGNLVLLGKEKGLKTAIDASGGDIVVGLKKYMGKVARKEAVMEASLFVILTEAMEQPSVQKWIAEKANMIKYSGREDIRGMVEKEGYDWGNVKEIFMAISTKNPDGSKNDDYSREQSGEDNSLLKKAWLKGWRPELGRDWLFKNPKYQTKTFKSLLSTPERSAALRSDDPDFVKKDNERYFDDIDHVKLYNKNANVRGDNLNYDEAASEMERAINGN